MAKKIHNAFQTNGSLLSDAWCQLFREHNFVGISIDGPAHVHDRYRSTKQGTGSHQLVMRGLALLKRHQVPFNTHCGE